MEYKGLVLDGFQKLAINALDEHKSVIVSAPTGSGKTLIADYIIDRDLKKKKKVIYTAPIKALSNQKFKDFSKDYGSEKIGLLTGDIVKNTLAPVLIMTTEIYRNMVLARDPLIEQISSVIFDEIHYINDRERGVVWEESIIFSPPHVRFLCLSATIPNAKEFAFWIETISEHPVEVIGHSKRIVPLTKTFYDVDLGITTLKKIHELSKIPRYRGPRRKGKKPQIKRPSHINLVKEIKDVVPCLFFTFSRLRCQKFALELQRQKIFTEGPRIRAIMREHFENAPPEISQLETTQVLKECLPYGIGFHHAGLLPLLKELVEELFSKGLIKVLYTTETFAVGINMPAKSVCFESLRKYDGVNFRFLNSKEYFQIAGRAGRRGIDKEGFVYSMIDRKEFDYHYINQMTTVDKDPIISQFRLSINTVLNLVKRHTEDEINVILCKSFDAFQQYGKQCLTKKRMRNHYVFEKSKKKLEQMGYIAEGKLTSKGEFTSQIYADELLIGEIFGTAFYQQLNEYHMLLILACICYEPRRGVQFYKKFPDQMSKEARKKVQSSLYLSKEKRFMHLEELTAFIHPCYYSKTLFEILAFSNLLEGDIIRFFRQIIDRIGQITSATNDMRLKEMLHNCQHVIEDCIRDVDAI